MNETSAAGTIPPPIRVAIIGDHPHAGAFGWIEGVDGGYKTLRVLGGELMVKVNLDSGNECYAKKEHLKKIASGGDVGQARAKQ